MAESITESSIKFPINFQNIWQKHRLGNTCENVINSDYNLGSGLRKQVLKSVAFSRNRPAASLVSGFYGELGSTHIPIKSSHVPETHCDYWATCDVMNNNVRRSSWSVHALASPSTFERDMTYHYNLRLYPTMKLAIQMPERKHWIDMYYSSGYCWYLSIKGQLRRKKTHLRNLQITLEIRFWFYLKSGDLAEPLEIITVNYRMLLEHLQSFCWFTSVLCLPKNILASALYRELKACYLSKAKHLYTFQSHKWTRLFNLMFNTVRQVTHGKFTSIFHTYIWVYTYIKKSINMQGLV